MKFVYVVLIYIFFFTYFIIEMASMFFANCDLTVIMWEGEKMKLQIKCVVFFLICVLFTNFPVLTVVADFLYNCVLVTVALLPKNTESEPGG